MMTARFKATTDIREESGPQVAVLSLEGSVDSQAIDDLQQVFGVAADDGARHFVLDFGGVTYISSVGLRQLLEFRKAALDAGGRMCVCGLRQDIRENVFEALGFARIIQVYSDVEEALASFSR